MSLCMTCVKRLLYDRSIAKYHGIMNSKLQNQYPRARMDALFDGIFAVAMTLLVLDVKLPDDFHPNDATQLISGLIGLLPKVFPYLLSFFVLGNRWLAGIQTRSRVESVGGSYIRWWLLYLLLITCVPFTTIVVGRYASLAPAIWLYAGNTALIAITAWRLLELTPEVEDERHRRERRFSLLVLLVSALACIGWSFVNSAEALLALLLNFAPPALIRWARKAPPSSAT